MKAPRDGELCARCDHRYAVHAGHPGTACVRYLKGQRCPCREFVRPETYENAKRHLAGRQDSWGWTREDVEAQNIVSAVEDAEPPKSLRHLRTVYKAAVERVEKSRK